MFEVLSVISGEQRVATALGKQRTSEKNTFLWWQEPTLRDPKRQLDRCPDFVVVSQAFGLLVLEVKDWVVEQIVQADLQTWSVRKNGLISAETAPSEQARVASHVLRTLLEREPSLQASGAHAGKLKVPVAYGAVLANVTRSAAASTGLLRLVEGSNYFFQDDLGESFPAHLEQVMRSHFPVPPLTPELLERVADTIAPIRQISAVQDLETPEQTQLIQRLDEGQKELAYALGAGHRILTGCAGSGKTLVVAARARFLKQTNPLWRIRIICYNSELVPYIYKFLGDVTSDSEPKISVQNFHAFARECLGGNVERQANETEASLAERTAAAFVQFGDLYSGNGLYQALLIDEGQDLRPEWTNALVKLVDRSTESVLFAASRQQNIYGISTYRNMGIEAQGRTKHLRRSYRCSAEILALAEAFRPDPLQERKRAADSAVQSELFTSSERGSSRLPQFVSCADTGAAVRYICDEVRRVRRAELCAFRDLAVLYTDRYIPLLEPLATALCNEFGSQHVFAKWKAGARLMPDDDSLKMTTIHGSKGLEWRIVFVLGMDKKPQPSVEPERERSLAYVALTRAQNEIHFVSLRNSGFHKDLKELSEAISGKASV